MDEEIELKDENGKPSYNENKEKKLNLQELLVVIIFGCKIEFKYTKEIIKNCKIY